MSDAAPSDAELTRRVLAGETDLFAVLVRRYQTVVFRVAAAMLHDPGAAGGVAHQAFVSAFEHLDQYRTDLPFEQWVKGIARNVVRKEALRTDREERRISLYREFVLSATAASEETDEHERDVDAALAACREKLAPAAARALVLRYEEDRPLEDVAAAIGRTLGGTRQLLFRIRIALRDCLQQRLARA